MERHLSNEQDVNYNCGCPHIDLCIVGFALQYFRGGVLSASKTLCEFLIFLKDGRKTKVGKLYFDSIRALLANEDVLELNVTMNYVVLMEVLKSREQLLGNRTYIILA